MSGGSATSARDASDLVGTWRARLAAVARNLTDLASSPELARMRRRRDDANSPYRGRTAEAAASALAGLDGLWRDYLALSDVVERAVAASRRSRLLRDPDAEVRALLEAPSVEVPAPPTPSGHSRGLLDRPSGIRKATPAAVLDAMTAGFARVREAVLGIARAEDEDLPSIAALGREAALMRDWMPPSGKALLAGLPAKEGDPLALASALRPLRQAVLAARAAKDAGTVAPPAPAPTTPAAPAPFAEARARLDRLRRAEADGIASPRPAATAVDLAAWLDRIAAADRDGRHEAARIGHGRWDAAVRASEAALAEAGSSPGRSASRQALSGHLAALRDRAPHARAELEAFHRRAVAALAAEPFDLAAARRAVLGYEAAIGASLGPGRGTSVGGAGSGRRG